ncbi:interleukin-18-binding protein isoform X2 [Sphaerodactylus townsendi]|uniref:interleukin-18-binding protein isoform X2 n=1 Tax=Sphaerodactylus townsendi TaxID=933632 RepID=UPI002025F1D0|nr:interleukin-18-binding protein isoform X2 [Sphaerodactylus townsendi]
MNSAPGLRFQVQGLLLVLLCGCIYLQGTDAKWRPSINSTWEIRPSFGQNFSVPCQGSSAFRTCSIYWLANGSFVEELYPDGAVREEEAREISHGPGRHHLLSRELVFHAFSKRDLRTTFRCVILDPAGAAQKTLTLQVGPRRAGGAQEVGPRSGESGSGIPEEP